MVRGEMAKFYNGVEQKFISFFTVSVDSYVSSSLNTIGWTDNTNGCFTHWIFERIYDMLSKRAHDNAMSGILQRQAQEAQIEPVRQ